MGEVVDFHADRVLRLVRDNTILRKVYARHHPKGDKNEAVLRSVFNALIKDDSKMMALYQLTK